MLQREDQERTNPVLWTVCVSGIRLVFLSEAEPRVRALRLRLQALRAAGVPEGGAEGKGDAGVPAAAVVRVREAGRASLGWS